LPNRIFCTTDKYNEFDRSEDDGVELLLPDVNFDEDQFYLPDQVSIIQAVFHVVYHEDVEKIERKRIMEQIDSLNNDFRNRNIDNVIFNEYSREKGLATDSKIEFIIAQKDPNGSVSEGITYRHTDIEYFLPASRSSQTPLSEQPVKSTCLGGTDAWDTTRYLNIWICNLYDACGYAQYPICPNRITDEQLKTDGVVVDYRCFGSNGSNPGREKGKTLTHEIGHWLGLYHLWGTGRAGTGCNDEGDLVRDTPPQRGPHRNRPHNYTGLKKCNGYENPLVLNFMDEWDDEYSLMFSRGQVARIHYCLAHRPYIIT
jgi:hypothetical protein